MVGRRRRTSDSTTGTMDPEGTNYAEELTVLKKFSQDLDDVDSMLQTFVLEDATVYDKAGRPVELFTVRTKGPFTIRGRVVIEDNQKSRVKKPSTRTALIETKHCIRYAIGESDRGYGAWAGGQAGWYEIRPPSAAYKPIYDHTIEGVSIYYTMMSAIEEHKAQGNKGKKGKRRKKSAALHEDLSIDTLLLKYAVAVGDGATYDEVVARCDDHAPFLISHFYEDSNAFDWPPTVFFKWIVERHPDIHANVLESRKKVISGPTIQEEIPQERAAIGAPVVADDPPAQKALTKRTRKTLSLDANTASDDVDAHDSAQRSIRSRSRAKTKTESQSPPPAAPPVVPQVVEPMEVDATMENSSDQTAPRSHVELLLEGLAEIKPELEPLHKTAFSKVSSKLYYKYRIKEYYASAEILQYYARELLQRLEKEAWDGSGFWKKLEEAAKAPRITLQHITVDQIPSNLTRRKTISVPRTSKGVKASDPGESQKQVMETPPSRRPGRPAGKMSALRLVGSKGSKRRFDSGDDTPDTVSRGSKVAKTSHAYESEEDDAMDDDASSSGHSNDSEVDSAESPSAVKVVVRAENIPTSDPKGPNGTWVCDEKDCGFVVRNPDQNDGREKIQEHIQEAHYKEDENRDARINLAVTEGVKNHLPIEYFSPPLSPYFRYSCLSDDQPEVSPFWDSGPSGPPPDSAASSPQSATITDASDEDAILPGALDSVSRSLLPRMLR